MLICSIAEVEGLLWHRRRCAVVLGPGVPHVMYVESAIALTYTEEVKLKPRCPLGCDKSAVLDMLTSRYHSCKTAQVLLEASSQPQEAGEGVSEPSMKVSGSESVEVSGCIV